MNQFTSHIDFMLTRKRLVLLNKNQSLARKFARLFALLPALLFVTFLFCDRQTNPNELYSDVRLQHMSSPYDQVQDSGVYYDSRMYDMSSELFTGTQNYYLQKDDRLVSSVTFKEGLRVKEQIFNEDGEERYRTEVDYNFKTGERVSVRMFDNDILTMEIIDSSLEHNGMYTYREWHLNGQLKFQSTSDENGTQGHMTLYNDKGTIIEQELYKDGELIEKIK